LISEETLLPRHALCEDLALNDLVSWLILDDAQTRKFLAAFWAFHVPICVVFYNQIEKTLD
jgi:hypothetical protein